MTTGQVRRIVQNTKDGIGMTVVTTTPSSIIDHIKATPVFLRMGTQ